MSINMSSMYRLTGLASGMDIDSIVTDLMNAHRMKLDKVEQEKQVWQWRQQDYRSINTDLLILKNQVFDLKLQRSFLAKQVDCSSNVVSATVSGDALNGSHTLEVESLARGALLASGSNLEGLSGSSADPLAKMFPGLTPASGGKVTITIGDGSSSKDFTINPDTQSLNDLINKINESSLDIRASWDSNLQRFYLSSTKLGAESTVSCKDKAGNLAAMLLGNGEGTGEFSVQGEDARVKIDGISYSFNSNQFKVNEISYNVKGITTGAISVTVSEKIDSMVENIKGFVEKYNEVLGSINGKLTEERFPEYKPLTDQQQTQANLTDKQIDQWQDKAKSGLLKGDQLLDRLSNSLRRVLSSRVEGLTGEVTTTNNLQKVTSLADQLSAVGITTGSYQERGRLYLDEDKLREALQSNPQAVMDLFTKTRDASGKEITNKSEQGLAVQLYDAIDGAISMITEKAGSASNLYDDSAISKKVRNFEKNISRMEDRFKTMETRYYKQFTAMEQAIAQMNSQSMWLAQQFGGSE